MVGRWGGGGYAVVQGFAISAGAGLLLNVAAGQAMMDGPVTVPANTTLALLDNTARSYCYLSQTGVLVAVANSLTPPAGGQVFIGSAVTAGGVVTSVDQSGILYLRGGTLWRNTADAGLPGDTPPATLMFFNRGAGTQLWFWDGTAYTDVNAGGDVATAVILAPTTSARNVVQPTADAVIPLILKWHSVTQSGDMIEVQDNTGAVLFSIAASGNVVLAEGKNLVAGTATGTKIGTVGGAAGQKLAFWGSNPVVQPLLATGAAHTVDDVITTLQSLGLCRQT